MPYERMPATRLFPRELWDIRDFVKGSMEEKRAGYIVTNLGAKVGRMFVMGTVPLIEKQSVTIDNIDYPEYTMQVMTPLEKFYVRINGKFNPDMAGLVAGWMGKEPFYVAVLGKPRVYENSEGRQYVNVTPENMRIVERADVDAWEYEALVATAKRIDGYVPEDAPKEFLKPEALTNSAGREFNEEEEAMIDREAEQ